MKRYFVYSLIVGVVFLSGCQTTNTNFITSAISSDSSITTEVNQAFANHPLLTGIPIHVQTVKKVVELSGYVKTIRQSDVAGEVAAKVAGVQMVQNNLIVRK